MATGRTQRPRGWRGHTRGWVGMPSHCIKKSYQQRGKVPHWTSNILLSTVSLLCWNVILAAAIPQASYYDTLSPSTHKMAASAPGLCDKGLKWTWHLSVSSQGHQIASRGQHWLRGHHGLHEILSPGHNVLQTQSGFCETCTRKITVSIRTFIQQGKPAKVSVGHGSHCFLLLSPSVPMRETWRMDCMVFWSHWVTGRDKSLTRGICPVSHKSDYWCVSVSLTRGRATGGQGPHHFLFTQQALSL